MRLYHREVARWPEVAPWDARRVVSALREVLFHHVGSAGNNVDERARVAQDVDKFILFHPSVRGRLMHDALVHGGREANALISDAPHTRL